MLARMRVSTLTPAFGSVLGGALADALTWRAAGGTDRQRLGTPGRRHDSYRTPMYRVRVLSTG